MDCSTDLSPDLYGLGVRLGYYFQWFSGWVSNNFIVDEMGGGLDANSIFLGSLIISILYTTQNNTLTQVDALIILQLCAGTVWSVLSVWGYRTCVYRKEGLDGIKRFGGFGTHLRLMLGAAVAGYSIWFWVIGVRGTDYDGLAPFTDGVPGYCTHVSVFKVPIAGPVRHVILGIGVTSVIYNLLLTLVAPLAIITRTRKFISFYRSGQLASSTRLRYATGATKSQLRIMSIVFSVFNFCWMLFMMFLVEITLNENHIQGVLGAQGRVSTTTLLQPGQFLPMLIGTFSFTRCLFIAFELYRYPDGDITPSLGRAKSRHEVKVKADAKRASNVFKMFSQANEEADEEQNLVENSPKQPAEAEDDPFTTFHQRLTPLERVMITWLPWLSLLYFWPWRKDRGVPVSQHDDQASPNLLTDSPMPGYTAYDTEMTSIHDDHKRVSQISYEEYTEQQPQRMV